ncbi:class I SAM-dependent methyltransferase [Catenulispora rubra]|uniref:class I SAM-dependent methyltransferase n=1 Tax=Catenulispora rubra TaxID=280293 RepID=UPI00189277E6|nr:class I SAM-dependent methyltransferase [Catenulispora rubra]
MDPTLHVARFDAWAPVYEASALQEAFYTRLHRKVLGLASAAGPAPGRIVDIGCGTGRLLRAAAVVYPDAGLVGVDISAGMLAQARAMAQAQAQAMAAPGERTAFVRADCAALPFGDAGFDLATCTASSHHWPEPAVALAELRRVLAPDGLLVLAHLQGVAPWDPPAAGHIRRRGVRISSGLAVPLFDSGFRVCDAALFAECPLMPATVVLCARRR